MDRLQALLISRLMRSQCKLQHHNTPLGWALPLLDPLGNGGQDMGPFGLVCAVLVNSNSLIANYGVKQSQFIKPTSEPRASDPEKSNEAFDCAIRG